MKLDFQGRNIEVEKRLLDHARPRLEGLEQLNDRIGEVRVTVSKQKGLHTVELTCSLNGNILRSEVHDHDELTAFDQALDKLERQLVRYKDKMVDRRKRARGRQAAQDQMALQAAAQVMREEATAELEDEFDEFKIVRTKSHALKPMTPEEAVLQMEMVGHDFYVFLDGETERVAVVYRRRVGDYGLIEPEEVN
jgi:putative sigma-54 modulation protein